MALKLSKQEDILSEEAKTYGVTEALKDEILAEVNTSLEEAEQTEEYKIVEEFRECKQTGKINQLYRIADELINGWKQEFRREHS